MTKLAVLLRSVFFLLMAICVTNADAHSQNQKVTLNVNAVSLQKVFKEIKKQTGLVVFYSDALINDQEKLTITVKDEPLSKVMDQIIMGKPLQYEIQEKYIVISARANEKKQTPPVTEGLNPRLEATPPPTVHGRITNEKGEPVAGVSIAIKGGKVIGVTNDNGEFTLNNIADNATLVFSAITIETFETKLNGRNELALSLKTKVSELQEVIINKGYYSEKRRLSTGNITVVTSKDIEKQPVLNPLLALQGQVPGLVINQVNGLPGGAMNVNILGQNSIANGNDPFFVIDGVPYNSQMPITVGYGVNTLGGLGGNTGSGNPLSYINSSDIESIEVLKDADATAIYGSRAANGAILITTKKGKANQTRVDVNLQTGWGNVASKLKVMNSRQYIDMRLEAKRNDNATIATTDYDINGFWDSTRNTDWQKVLIGNTAHYALANAGISGGFGNSQYVISGTYQRQTSVYPADFADSKGSVHLSLTSASANQKFKMVFSANYMSDNNTLPTTDLTNTAILLAPTAPSLYDKNGELNWQPTASGTSTFTNPLLNTLQDYRNRTENLVSNAVFSYHPIADLELKSSLGYNKMNVDETSILPLTSNKPEDRPFNQRVASFNNTSVRGWIIEPQANYTKRLGGGILNATIGASFQSSDVAGYSLIASGQNSDAVLYDIKSALTIRTNTSIVSSYRYTALFGRLNYVLKDKYIINLTGRRDGSSRFGPDNSMKSFGAIGAAWLFGEETPIKKISFISFAKLKFSIGTTGNDQIGDYRYYSLYNPVSVSLPYQNVVALEPTSLSNPLLQWEAKKSIDIGLETGFLKDRIFASANYSRGRTSNQLIGYAIPIITGFSSITSNFPATVQNTVWEFVLNTVNIRTAKFSWKSSINLTLPNNKLISFDNLATSSYANQLIIGQPVSVQKTFHFLGVDPATGLYQIANRSGVPASTLTDADKTVLVNTLPKFYGGVQEMFTYGNIQLDFLFQFTSSIAKSYFGGAARPGLVRQNEPITVMSRWQKPGDITNVQRYGTASTLSAPFRNLGGSDASFSDASFVRLKNISLSWRLDDRWIKRTGFKNVSLQLSAQNLFTITHYDGLDPETGISAMPPIRMVTAGIKATL